MDSSTLRNAPGARANRKRVGRGPGSGTGKTCGRGHKGQKSRAGYSARRGFEGGQMPLNRRLPKRGFNHRDRFPLAIVNVASLEEAFESGAEVTPESLVKARLVAISKGGVKILGDGELTKSLVVRVNAVSAGARTKIEAAGGSIEILTADHATSPKNAKPKAGGDAAPAGEER